MDKIVECAHIVFMGVRSTCNYINMFVSFLLINLNLSDQLSCKASDRAAYPHSLLVLHYTPLIKAGISDMFLAVLTAALHNSHYTVSHTQAFISVKLFFPVIFFTFLH